MTNKNEKNILGFSLCLRLIRTDYVELHSSLSEDNY